MTADFFHFHSSDRLEGSKQKIAENEKIREAAQCTDEKKTGSERNRSACLFVYRFFIKSLSSCGVRLRHCPSFKLPKVIFMMRTRSSFLT